jgi:hypothetical protein
MHLLSIDLAQLQDFTAYAVLRQVSEEEEDTYQVHHLKRLERGMSYVDQMDRIRDVYDQLPDSTKVIADATGVGQAVVDMIDDLRPVEIWIHGGEKVTQKGSRYRVPKRELAGVLQRVLSERRLNVHPELEYAEILKEEMTNFKAEIDPDTGHESYAADWRDGDHDDLVLAVAMGLWYAERRGPWFGGGFIAQRRPSLTDARTVGYGMGFSGTADHPGVSIR